MDMCVFHYFKNMKDEDGMTSLHIAARLKDEAMAAFLLENGKIKVIDGKVMIDRLFCTKRSRIPVFAPLNAFSQTRNPKLNPANSTIRWQSNI